MEENKTIPIINKKVSLLEVSAPLFDIRGAAFEAFKFFGRNVDEKTYETGIKMELDAKGYRVLRQEWFDIYYKGQNTKEGRRIDLAIESPTCGTIICELKHLKTVGDKERSQLFTYLRLLNCQLGMLINFSPDTGVYTELWKMDLKDYSTKRMVSK